MKTTQDIEEVCDCSEQSMKKIRFKLKKRFIFLAGGIILTGVFLFVAVDHELSVTYYTFRSDKIEQPFRVVLLADLHSHLYGKEQEILIEEITRQNPDLILMAGDIADNRVRHTGTIKLLEGIADKYPCFYVTGNHEIKGSKSGSPKDIFIGYGVSVLDGKNEVVSVNGQLINICGADDPSVGREQLNSAFSDIDNSLLTLFLYHRPERFEQVSVYEFDLMLAGHVHGGQWRIPYIVDGIYSPNQGLFPKYTAGMYVEFNRTMIISRGLALNSGLIPRIFNPPEIVVIDIIPSYNNGEEA
ncbi:MAG: metallophosphoesterase [Oscillospiraceae bacterium]|nr:metallophosphoesterase [Oscillospiraceae bacterium]